MTGLLAVLCGNMIVVLKRLGGVGGEGGCLCDIVGFMVIVFTPTKRVNWSCLAKVGQIMVYWLAVCGGRGRYRFYELTHMSLLLGMYSQDGNGRSD